MFRADRIVKRLCGEVNDNFSSSVVNQPQQPGSNLPTEENLSSSQEINPTATMTTTTTISCLKSVSSTNSMKKTVTFHSKVRVILIPTRHELQPIHNKLYYSIHELEMCKNDTFYELDVYRFSKACLEKRDLLVKLGVFYDVDSTTVTASRSAALTASSSPSPSTVSMTGKYESTDKAKGTLVSGMVGESDTCDTDSECSSVVSSGGASDRSESIFSTPTKSDNGNDDYVHSNKKAEVLLPDATFRYPVNLSSFDKNECAMRIASVILYQPFTSFVGDLYPEV